MLVRRPGNFRWDTEKPFTQQIVANDEIVWVYDPELQQATRQLLDKQVGNTPALLLSGDSAKMSESFSISEDKEKPAKGHKVFVLKPKDKDALFETLRVSFSGNQLTGMQLRDSLGQKTDITFSQIKVNGKIADSVFQFTPPKGVDVINEL
jgi:outer membrane lipoprotein carrier protein